MGLFLTTEKAVYEQFCRTSAFLSEPARQPGLYKGAHRPFCLPQSLAAENLYPGIREAAIRFFASNQIKWHDGQGDRPSNHLCGSQVCCVNFLYPYGNQPEALAALLRPIYPTLHRMLPVEDAQFVTFEWIGLKNYLGERKGGVVAPDEGRTRGANFTSADAMVMFEDRDGARQIVLIEWKYTESYGPIDLCFSRNGTDRRKIYRWLWNKMDCPVVKDPDLYDHLFYEPFYQFMRQQLLAWRMELAGELGANRVSLLHIAPRANRDFRRVTSPGLADLGDSPTAIWSRLVKTSGRFHSVATEDLFGPFPASRFAPLSPWRDYITHRYPWVDRIG